MKKKAARRVVAKSSGIPETGPSLRGRKRRNTFTISATGRPTGNGKMKPLLGGKGANLAEMTRIGLPVPPGFTISTDVCTYFYAHNRTYPKAMQAQVEDGVRRMEKIMGTKFGDTKAMPLLRFGALGRARLDARHDGHDSQSRPERRDRPRGRESDQ